jgi:phospholipid/cholesterol/gamma-HCH transport system substrate-binding protein
MLVNITHDTRAEHTRLFVAGVAFITVMAVLVGLSIAVYDKAFSHPTMVTIKAQSAGLQLAKFGDVRRHGALVGQVRSIGNDGKQAVIKVALVPSAAKNIPENISIDILPTTLFGQKYISIVGPTDPSQKSLSNGDVIPATRVHTNVELQKILADLFPLLRSIRPADLSSTLYALATALRGRGNQIGETFVKLDSYLTTMNVHLPTLQQDLALLARVTQTYSIAAPDLVRLLRNATTTAHTLTDKESQLQTFIGDVTTLGKTSTRVLTTNEANIVRAPALAKPLLGLLDTYSPELPCLLKGAARYAGRLNQIFSKGRVAQSMSLAATQRRPYDKRDLPVYGEHGHGPSCYGLPYPHVPLEPPVNFKNGTELDSTSGGNPQ